MIRLKIIAIISLGKLWYQVEEKYPSLMCADYASVHPVLVAKDGMLSSLELFEGGWWIIFKRV